MSAGGPAVGAILPADFRNVVLRLRQTATRLNEVNSANQQLRAERDAHSAELAACQRLLARALGDADAAEAKAEARLEAAREECARLESARRRLEGSLREHVAHAKLREQQQGSALETDAEALAAALARCTALERSVVAERERCASFQADAAAWRAELADAVAELERERGRAKARAEAAVAPWAADLASAAASLDEQRAASRALTAELAAARADAMNAARRAARAEAEAEAARANAAAAACSAPRAAPALPAAATSYSSPPSALCGGAPASAQFASQFASHVLPLLTAPPPPPPPPPPPAAIEGGSRRAASGGGWAEVARGDAAGERWRGGPPDVEQQPPQRAGSVGSATKRGAVTSPRARARAVGSACSCAARGAVLCAALLLGALVVAVAVPNARNALARGGPGAGGVHARWPFDGADGGGGAAPPLSAPPPLPGLRRPWEDDGQLPRALQWWSPSSAPHAPRAPPPPPAVPPPASWPPRAPPSPLPRAALPPSPAPAPPVPPALTAEWLGCWSSDALGVVAPLAQPAPTAGAGVGGCARACARAGLGVALLAPAGGASGVNVGCSCAPALDHALGRAAPAPLHDRECGGACPPDERDASIGTAAPIVRLPKGARCGGHGGGGSVRIGAYAVRADSTERAAQPQAESAASNTPRAAAARAPVAIAGAAPLDGASNASAEAHAQATAALAGCYADRISSRLYGSAHTAGANSVPLCARACGAQHAVPAASAGGARADGVARWFALSAGRCACGDAQPDSRHARAADGECAAPCAGRTEGGGGGGGGGGADDAGGGEGVQDDRPCGARRGSHLFAAVYTYELPPASRKLLPAESDATDARAPERAQAEPAVAATAVAPAPPSGSPGRAISWRASRTIAAPALVAAALALSVGGAVRMRRRTGFAARRRSGARSAVAALL
ncbi:hypothetical protein KFE25_010431 [Diacronema lutheri]|uniref:WSC domain-containing protein n=2 Tax=Diacronema lutheri TaxID=2081491 RepID=A0A8J6C955_DIALT|nr:hypothetical protein KFE25_010431 [Diacronema lutheri]